ncbi:MAG: hypothetical protein ACUVUS_03010 [Thermoproteota archaeon]
MDEDRLTYLEEEDTLVLEFTESCEATISISKVVLKTVFMRVEGGFKLSLSTLKGGASLRLLIIKDVGPAALILTDEVVGRIRELRLSWEGRDLKIEGLKISENPLELSFIFIPIDVTKL